MTATPDPHGSAVRVHVGGDGAILCGSSLASGWGPMIGSARYI
jgi:hypothetical protein